MNTTNHSKFYSFAISLALLLITACNSGTNGNGDGETIFANKAPTVTISSPTSGSNFNDGTTINFSGSANDDEDGDIGGAIVWSSDIDGELGSGATLSASLSHGIHTISASVTDSNSSTKVTSISLSIVDPNTAPFVSIDSPTNRTTFEQSQAIEFSGTATDTEDGNISANIIWNSDLDGQIGTGASFSTSLSIGSHTITATITDSNQSSVENSIELTITQAPGSISAVTDSDASTNQVDQFASNGTSVGITALATDTGDTVTYSLTNDASGRFAIDANSGVVTVADGSLLDAANASSHDITILAISSDSSSSNATFTIVVNSSGCAVTAGQTSTASYTIEWDQITDPDLTGFKVYYSSNENFTKSDAQGSFDVSGDVVSTQLVPNDFGLVTCDQIYLAVTSVGLKDESSLSNKTSITVE